jgi:ABC-type glycerol-3-phosphate transport system substrate-binding protein
LSANFVAWMTSPAVEKQMTLLFQQVSAITALGNDPEVIAMAPFLPVVMQQLANGRSEPQGINWSAFRADLIVALSEIATTNNPPAEVLGRLQRQHENTDFSR